MSDKALVLLVCAAMILAIFGYGAYVKYREVSTRKRAERERQAKLAAEQTRIASLPKLNTRWLMKVPEKLTQAHGYFTTREALARTFGNRYNRLIIFDERGEAWVGLFMPETLKSLCDGEYIHQSYFVPFKGPGEAYSGAPLQVDGRIIDIYPMWLNPVPACEADARLWASFEEAFEREYRGRNHYEDYFEHYPSDKRLEFEEKRRKFSWLSTAITA